MKSIGYIGETITEYQELTLTKFLSWDGFGIQEIHCLEVSFDVKRIPQTIKFEIYTWDDIKDLVNNTFGLFACPNSYNDNKSDIWKVINYALVKGKLVYVIFPDGSYKKWRAG